MSSDFAFSETTPLRQTDCSNAISITTATALANSRNNNNIQTGSSGGSSSGGGAGTTGANNLNKNHVLNSYNTSPTSNSIINSNNSINNNNLNRNNNLNTNNNNSNSSNNVTTTAGAIIQLETGQNSNYNGFSNRILARTAATTTVIAVANNNNIINGGLNNKMDTNRKIVRKIALDFAVLLCVGLPILCFFLFVEPYKRGFFCDDESLKHPFHDSTVKNYMLYIIGLVLPLCIIVPMEFFHGRRKSMPTYRFMDFDLPSWIVESYKQVGIFAFGAGSQQFVVDIAKYSVGRLRPHFFDVCQPIMADGTRCDDEKNIGRYIEDFTCYAQNSTPRMLKDMRLSFPSGHASFSAFTMIYCMIYLQSRMNWRGSKLLKHFLQILLLSITWFTALSRISDYKHHWSDVLAGGLIGVIFAIVTAHWIADFDEKKSELPRTHHDMPPQTNLNTTTTHQHQNNTNGHNGRT